LTKASSLLCQKNQIKAHLSFWQATTTAETKDIGSSRKLEGAKLEFSSASILEKLCLLQNSDGTSGKFNIPLDNSPFVQGSVGVSCTEKYFATKHLFNVILKVSMMCHSLSSLG
jgi:hypothetical protein